VDHGRDLDAKRQGGKKAPNSIQVWARQKLKSTNPLSGPAREKRNILVPKIKKKSVNAHNEKEGRQGKKKAALKRGKSKRKTTHF